jgi:hypothetical protein
MTAPFTNTSVVVQLKHSERNKYYLVVEVIAALVNANEFDDAIIVLESFNVQRKMDCDYDQFKHYLTRCVSFAEQ